MATTQSPNQRDYDKNPAQDEFDKLIDRNFSPGDERAMEERAKEGAAEDLSKSNSAEKKETGLLGGRGDDSRSFYTKGAGQLKNWRQNRKLLFLLLGFINVFKLDHIMSNVDATTFARLNGVQDRRSVAWQRAYLQMRLMDMGNNADMTSGQERNILFRSSRVSTGQPVRDWYRTMRTSKFEQDLLDKHGIKFTSMVNAEGKVRPGRIDIKGEKPIPLNKLTDSHIKGIQDGDMKVINQYYQYLDDEVFNDDRTARKAIKKAVNDNTHWAQVFKRRHVRKSIQNMTGVRDWRFFENTRNKSQEKKIDVRNKILDKALPESTKSGLIARCLFGVDDCTFNRDPEYPGNKASGSVGRGSKQGSDQVKYSDVNEDNQPVQSSQKFENDKVAQEAAETAAKIGGQVGKVFVGFTGVGAVINVVGALEMLAFVDENISNLDQLVLVAKGTQAMGLYQTYGTARDQLRTGEVDSAEVNDFMSATGNFTATEGWRNVVEGESNPAAGKEKYCSKEHQIELDKNPVLAQKEFAHMCADQQVGSETRANKIKEAYEQSIGGTVGVIVEGYKGIRGAPIIGSILKGINKLFNALFEKLGGALTGIMNALGLGESIEALMSWAMAKVASFLGAGPIISENTAPGVIANYVIQGGAYTAEAVSRTNGGRLTTAEDAKVAKMILSEHEAEEMAEGSIVEKYFALSNTKSFASRSIFGLSQLRLSDAASVVTDVAGVFRSVFSTIVSPFTPRATADGSVAYRASEFAGIPTYDLPEACFNLDPITASPKDGTNIQSVISGIPDAEITWELVTNSDEWYSYIYSKLEDDSEADQEAEKIYNCHLLDTSIRGSLGFLYGYTNDNGLEESSTSGNLSSGAPAEENTGGVVGDVNAPSDKIACAEGTKDLGIIDAYNDGQKIKMRACAVSNISCSNEECTPGSRYYVKGADRKAIVNSRVSGAFYSMAEEAKQAGIELAAFSSFRTMQHQTDIWNGNPNPSVVAPPGHSFHQLGIAIDFADTGSVTANCSSNPVGLRASANTKTWRWLHENASKFGIKQYCAESWHWDASNLPSRVS
jgi:hypothetical protein